MAYDDNKSNYSANKSQISRGGNGNPNKLPGLMGESISGKRIPSLVPGMERNDSVGSASNIKEVDYKDNSAAPKDNLSSGLILDNEGSVDDAEKPYQQRPSGMEMPQDEYNTNNSGMGMDRLNNSDIGLLGSKPNQNYTTAGTEQDSLFKKAAMKDQP